jgi:SAM-dependent methyltransferase
MTVSDYASAGAPFDRIAADYDTTWTRSSVGRAQRDAVWDVVDRLFQPGDEILDVGCGTGEDAVHLGRRGVHVSGIDASGEMVKIACSRGVAATRLAIEELERIHARYDGLLSDFGALNCTADIERVASSFARLVRPRGYAVVCLLNRTCAWEMAWYTLRLWPRTAFRRLTRGPVPTSLGLPVYYPSARLVQRAFGRDFELIRSRGVGVTVPPSFVRLPRRLVRIAEAIDSHLGCLPVFRACGDHRLYVFRRRLA